MMNNFKVNETPVSFTNSVMSNINAGRRYAPRYTYNQLVSDIAVMGAVPAVKKYLAREMKGNLPDYSNYFLKGQQNLLVEHAVLKHSNLFDADEISFCLQLFPDYTELAA